MLQHYPTVTRLWKFLRGLSLRDVLMRFVFVIVSLVTLVALAVAFENWRSAREWRAWQATAEARGERFDLASVVPPMPPPERNFAMTPLLRPLTDFVTNPQVNGATGQGFRDPKAYERLQAINLDKVFGAASPSDGADFNLWQMGEKTNLAAWAQNRIKVADGSSALDTTAKPLAPAQVVLDVLSKYDAEMDELSRASALPESVFQPQGEGAYMKLPHLGVIGVLEKVVTLHALARGASDDKARAFDEMMFAQRLAEVVRTNSVIVPVLARAQLHTSAMQPVWETLAERRLTSEQLAVLQPELARVNLVEQLARATRGEITFVTWIFEQLRARKTNWKAMEELMPPQPWWLHFLRPAAYYRGQLISTRYYMDGILPALDTKAGVINIEAISAAWGKEVQPSLGYPLNAVSVRLLGQFEGLAKRIAQAQAYQNMVIIACALERWSLAHGGGYPDSTSALVPEFLAKLPIDPVNGQPLRYRRTDDGRYRLWSVGANLKDEDGTPGIDVVGPKDTRRISNDPNKGDWVWSYQKL